MNIQVIIEDKQEKYKEIINIDDCVDKRHFSYKDSDEGLNEVNVYDDGITIFRVALTHKTLLNLRKDAYCEIITPEGTLNFLIKVLDLNVNNDNISIVYCLNDSIKSVRINYLGA